MERFIKFYDNLVIEKNNEGSNNIHSNYEIEEDYINKNLLNH